MTPDEVLAILKEGNRRFVNGKPTEKYFTQQVSATSSGQNPMAVILGCIDSRVTSELIFDQGLGEIFSIRIAGNIVNEDILGSLEYATEVIGSKVILVLGHTRCGAILGACNDTELGHLTTLLEKIKPSIKLETQTTTERNGSNTSFVKNVTELNVQHSIDRIRSESSIIAALESAGKIKIVGALYEVETGMITFYE